MIYLCVVYLQVENSRKIQPLFIGVKFVKDSTTLGECEKKAIVFELKNQKKQIKFHKSQIDIINEGNMLTNQC